MTHNTKPEATADAIREACGVLFAPQQVTELRAFGVPTGNGYTANFSGYFNDFDCLASEAARLDSREAEAVYIVLNPVNPDLLARAKNRTIKAKRGEATANEHVTARRWLFLDFDPVRPSGISSTDAEHEAALTRATACRDHLLSLGWPAPIEADSGNGAHLLYHVNLSADDGGLVKRCLEALAGEFSDEAVEVDKGIHNAARLCKLYGTTARKGDATTDRPHRRSCLLTVPETIDPVPERLLQALAAKVPTNGQAAKSQHGGNDSDRVRSALLSIPTRPAYDEWIRIIAAVRDAVGSDAEALLSEWSPEEKTGEYAEKLASSLNHVTAGTLVHIAKGHGWSYSTNGTAPAPSPHGALVVRPVREWLAGAAQKPAPKSLFGECWFDGELCILFAETNVGKSILGVQIAHSITCGNKALPGFRVDGTGGKVLLLDFELSDRQFLGRYSDERRTPFSFDPGFLRTEVNTDFDFDDGWEETMREAIESAIIETGARIVIVDNITYLKDETEKSRAALPLMRHLNSLKRRYGLSILALAHTPKRDASQPLTRNHLAGSRNLLNLADSCFALGESHKDEGIRYLKQIKVRETDFTLDSENVALLSLAKTGGLLRFTLEGYGSEVEHLRRRDAAETSELEASIIAQSENEPHLSHREIGRRLDTNHKKVGRVLERRGTGGTGGTGVPECPRVSQAETAHLHPPLFSSQKAPDPWEDVEL